MRADLKKNGRAYPRHLPPLKRIVRRLEREAGSPVAQALRVAVAPRPPARGLLTHFLGLFGGFYAWRHDVYAAASHGSTCGRLIINGLYPILLLNLLFYCDSFARCVFHAKVVFAGGWCGLLENFFGGWRIFL